MTMCQFSLGLSGASRADPHHRGPQSVTGNVVVMSRVIQSQPLRIDCDGVTARGEIRGEPGRPTVVSVHGYSQAGSCWDRQFESNLAEELTLVRYDLRGHGASDKPLLESAYLLESFTKELHSVINEVQRRLHPSSLFLCGWSFGVRIALNYVKEHGEAGLSGLVLVGGVANDDPAFIGPGLRKKGAMFSDDRAANEAATREFLRSCFHVQPSDEEFEHFVEVNMAVPPFVRKAMSGHPLDVAALEGRVGIPVLILHGMEDQIVLVEAVDFSRDLFPEATVSLFPDVGHSPFFENSERFSSELREWAL